MDVHFAVVRVVSALISLTAVRVSVVVAWGLRASVGPVAVSGDGIL